MGILDNSFSNLSDKEVSLLNEYFHGFDYRGAGYTYLSNYIWKDMYNLTWQLIDGYLFLSGGSRIFSPAQGVDTSLDEGDEKNEYAVVAMPLTNNGHYDYERLESAILKVLNKFRQHNLPFKMVMVPQHMKGIIEKTLPFTLDFEERPNDDEYVYLKDKLITLSGRALHKKKNHLNYFCKTYNYDVRELTFDMKDEILSLVNGFMEIKDRVYEDDEMNQLKEEAEAIENCISFLGDDNVYGVGLFIDNKMEGFAIGERLKKNTAVEHFEKANGEFRGIYQALCMEFCKSLPEEIEFVNREEDMGLENLRQAKRALRPSHMEKYYNITIRASHC